MLQTSALLPELLASRVIMQKLNGEARANDNLLWHWALRKYGSMHNVADLLFEDKSERWYAVCTPIQTIRAFRSCRFSVDPLGLAITHVVESLAGRRSDWL
jgi:hypothetical protein